MQKSNIKHQKSFNQTSKIGWFFVLIVMFLFACKTTSQVKKTENIGFSVPKTVTLEKTTRFIDSKYQRDLPILDVSANRQPHTRKDVLVVMPNLPYKSWRDLLSKNRNIRHFLITPGDYRKWGNLRPNYSGTAAQPYIFRYYDPKATQPYDAPHPVKRKVQKKEAVLERFHFSEISHWVLHGLTFRGQATEKEGKRGGLYNAFFQESNHNTLDFCSIEQVIVGNGVRIFNSSHNTIQRCVIRDKIEGFTGDNIGVTVYASKGRKSRNNRIVDNEIYDVTDGVQLVYQVDVGKNSPITGEVPGTIIDNNDLYITRKLYRQKNGEELACAEDGIDIKVGTNSTRPEDKVLVTNNRIWGFRTTDKTCSGGSHGSGIMIHRNAKNILIENNIIFDVARGISIAHGYKNERVSDITVRNNIFYDIQETADNAGNAVVLYADVLVESNTIKNTKSHLRVPATQHAVFKKNLVVESQQKPLKVKQLKCEMEGNHWVVKKVTSEASNIGKANSVSTVSREKRLKNYIFYTKRWTVPSQKVIPGIIQ